MNFQWYPGHMTRAKRQMMEDIRLVDLVIELLDARIPLSSRNPDIDEIAGGKSRLILLNKADLADPKITSQWMEYFGSKGLHVCCLSSLNAADMKQISPIVQKACAKKLERDRRRGIKNRPVRAMVAGIPNVGKSTFINSYARKAAAKTGNKPGVTKGRQWIRLSPTLELLDTPGILWPKFEDQSVGLKLALIGSIKDELNDTEELSLELIKLLNERYPGALDEFYKLEGVSVDDAISIDRDGAPSASDAGMSSDSARDLSGRSEPDQIITLLKIARVRGCLKSKAELDTLKAAGLLLENFRNGRIGRFTLEQPDTSAG